MKLSHKLLSMIIAISLLLTGSILPITASALTDDNGSENQIALGDEMLKSEKLTLSDKAVLHAEDLEISEESMILKYIDSSQFNAAKHVQRLTELEDLNTYVFANADGTRSIYMMHENVKYVDEDGTVREKDISLESRTGGFGIVQSNVELLIPNNPVQGIDLEYSGFAIKLIPLGLTNTVSAAQSDNSVVYDEAYGENTKLVYTPMLSGVKEDIVLSEYRDNATYSFILETDGLFVYNGDSGYYLADGDKAEPIFYLGEIVIYDAVGKPAEGTMTVEEVTAGEKYLLTVTADDDFLSDPTTVYPVTIDPSITVSDSTTTGSIIDSPVFEGYPSRNFGTYVYNRVGTPSEAYGIGRTVVKLSGLTSSNEYQNITANQITNVTFYAKEASGGNTHYINLYPLTSNTTWTESTVTWSNVGSFNTSVNYGNTMYNNQWTAFNITNLIKAWKNETYSADAGFIMTNENEANNKCFCASEYSTASYRPYVVMTYSEGISRSLYYSKYDPTKYNNSGSAPTVGSTTNLIQYRMNCYGYAFGYILNGNATITYNGGYKQQPGEFASTSNKANTVDNIVLGNPTASMANVVSNMRLDASRLGFTLTEYSTSSSTVAQYGVSSRLIAVVTGVSDYHFYMQHNDGTWSHKPGSSTVLNTSLTSNIVLTNSNIKTLANEGAYANGALKFFIITKTAVVDYPHGARCCLSWPCSHTQSALYRKELAGDYLQTSKTKYTGSTAARIDFAQDHDVYCFTPSTTKTYTITTTCSSGADLDCKLYDNAGVQIGSSTPIGQVSMTIKLVAGQKYYFDIYNYSKTVTDYTFSIS